MSFDGFPPRVRFTPVPSPLLGALLEQIDDLAELKCTLRLIWLLHQKKGRPRLVTLGELKSDPTLARSLARLDQNHRPDAERAVRMAVKRGTVLEGVDARSGQTVYTLNSEREKAALEAVADGRLTVSADPDVEAWDADPDRPNIFAVYEDNIGLMTPMIADELREAERLYPSAWIEDALREAVANNKRSWRYAARILERWAREGRGNGEPGRHPQKTGRYY